MSETDIFNQPSSGGVFFKPVLGHLILVVEVHRIEQVAGTGFKAGQTVDQAVFDFVDLSDPAQELHVRSRSSNEGIVNRLEAGKRWVLARVGQVDTGKGNPAWTLDEYAPGDEAVALAWKARYDAGQINQPVAPAAAAAAVAPAPVPAAAPVAAPLPATPPASQDAEYAALADGMTPEMIKSVSSLNPGFAVWAAKNLPPF